MARSRDPAGVCVCVFAPAPIVTVTIESRPDEAEELHLHAGGQGFWVARMLQTLGQERRAGDLLRLAVAAGAVNVTRHGLGSGDRDAIERLAERVELRDLEAVAP